MLMPEAAVDEHRGTVLREDDIGSAWKAPVVEPVAEACLMQASPDSEFWARIAGPYGPHVPRTRFYVMDVSHSISWQPS